MVDRKKYIAKRAAQELKNGDVVNLGIGLPSLIPEYVDPSVAIVLQSENGFLGLCAEKQIGEEESDIVNAGGYPASIEFDGSFFNSAESFAMIRGGHIDVTILGCLQVDANGNLANWMIPGKKIPGMGGAMDLVVGANKVIIAMEHTNNGVPKIVNHCSLPLTAQAAVDLIITEMAVIEVTKNGLVLKEYNPEYSIEQIQSATEAPLHISGQLKPYSVKNYA